jgi:ubiquinone/menaquinone biosynthesis C-methylase UbiE
MIMERSSRGSAAPIKSCARGRGMTGHRLNKEAYNLMAQQYQEKMRDSSRSGWNHYLEVPAMDSILEPIVENQPVLDLGCGTGLLTEKLIRWNAFPRGIDQSENMIAIARDNFPDVEFCIGTAESLPYKDGEFAIAASSLVLHYIKDLRPVFREISRVLKHRGELVFSMHHPFQERFKTNRERIGNKPVCQPYFHNDEYYWEMCGVRLLSFHHTFESIVKSLSSTGFFMKNLIECTPDKEAEGIFEGYDFTSRYPTFCVVHAVKTA